MTALVFTPTVDGVIAALLAPFFMSLGFYIWDIRWTTSNGSAFALNMYKCNIASTWFAIMAGIRGFSLEEYSNVFTTASVGYLILSSTLGIVIGDVLWLEALRLLGAKHVIVMDSLKPFAAAILGQLLLDESLHRIGYVGMVLTVLGVSAVAWEGQNESSKAEECDAINGVQASSSVPDEHQVSDGINCGDARVEASGRENEVEAVIVQAREDPKQINLKQYKRGYTCAALNVLADSYGSLLTKQYGIGMTTWSINLIRFGFAGIVLLCISLSMRVHKKCYVPTPMTAFEDTAVSATARIDDNDSTLHESMSNEKTTTTTIKQNDIIPKWFELPSLTTKGWLQITLGVAFVTFLCPALEKFALMQIALGLCAALTSVGPLYGVFMDWLFKSRRPTGIGFVGAVLAIGGVVILCVYGI